MPVTQGVNKRKESKIKLIPSIYTYILKYNGPFLT